MQSTSAPSLFRLTVAVVAFLGYASQTGAVPSVGLGVETRLNLFDAVPHIIGGENTQIEKVPYQAALELVAMHVCGGAIISDTWVLTAAHCVAWQTSGPTFLKRIRVGSTWEIPVVGMGGTTHSIADAQYHPKYTLAAIDYDVGVIKVTTKFELSPRVQAISIPADSEETFLDYKQNATVSGWGNVQLLGLHVPSFILRRGDIPLMPREQCQQVLRVYNFGVTSRMICAAGSGRGGPCHGDSGGPLVHKGQLIGLTSFVVNRCNEPTMPSGFSNILDQEIRSYVKQQTGI